MLCRCRFNGNITFVGTAVPRLFVSNILLNPFSFPPQVQCWVRAGSSRAWWRSHGIKHRAFFPPRTSICSVPASSPTVQRRSPERFIWGQQATPHWRSVVEWLSLFVSLWPRDELATCPVWSPCLRQMTTGIASSWPLWPWVQAAAGSKDGWTCSTSCM